MRPAVAAVGRGLLVALALAVPAAVAAQVADAVTDGDPGWIGYPLSVLVLAGVALGGSVAATRAREHAIALAAVTGFVAIGSIQILGAARRKAGGHDVAWSTAPAVTATAVALAMAAATLTVRRPGRTRP